MIRKTARYVIGDRLQVTIERLVASGLGLGRGPAGAVLVEYAAPGDVLEIEIESLRGGAARGRIVSIVQASPDRIEPPCRWYGTCGGCDLQHLRYEAQLDAKEMILRDALERIGGIRWTGSIETFTAPHPFGVRSRVELHTDPKSNEIGFFARRSRQIVAFDTCLVSRPEIDGAIADIRRSAKCPLPSSIHLLAGDGAVRSAPGVSPVEEGEFWLRIAGIDYRVSPDAFFQASLDLLPALIGRVTASAGSQRELAWDLFGGVGLFGLPLAQNFGQVTAVEIDRRAHRHAVASAHRNDIWNIRFVPADVTRWLGQRRQRAAHPDLIVVDPPRTGLERALSELLAEKRAPRLTYVSCDPATLARDLKVLIAGGFRLVDLAIFDLFPQTHHVETIARLAG